MIFIFNLLLALAWIALTGQFEPVNFLAGFVLSYLLLRMVVGNGERQTYFQRAVRLIAFGFFFIKEIILSNFRVARIVLSPRLEISPAIVGVPLDARSDLSIAVLANLITLTPGTLTLDISADRSVMYVHTMHAEEIDAFRNSIKDLERRVLEVTA